jgi:hypothetical protein
LATRLTLDQKTSGSSPDGAAEIMDDGKCMMEGGNSKYMVNFLQPSSILTLARSSSGLGRRPLKAEITGSNPVRATQGDYGLGIRYN